jgi:hypothetical protein
VAILLGCWAWWNLFAPDNEAKSGALRPVIPRPAQALVLLAGIALVMLLSYYGYWDRGLDDAGKPIHEKVAWAWYVPFGSLVAFVFGYLLARRRPADLERESSTAYGA